MSTVITVGRRGVITLPTELCEAFGLKENDRLVVEGGEPGLLLLRRADEDRLENYTEDRIVEFAADEAEVGRLLDSDPRSRRS